jgi:predicted dehydrogenase
MAPCSFQPEVKMTATFNWGLLSTARITRARLGGMSHSQRGIILGVASRDPGRARAFAAEKGLARSYGSYEDMLADPDIHIVYNPLPNRLHAFWTIRALEAGKHVLCEKPFAISVEEVDAVFAAAQRAGRVVAEAFMYRHHPKILKTKALIKDGAIGQPRTFNLTRPADVRWDPALAGGSLWDVGCYPVSFARYLFGAPERVHGWRISAPSGVDETFIGTLEFPGQRLAQFDSSFRLPYRSQAEIVGDAGLIRLERPFQPSQPAARLVLRRGDEEEDVELENPDMYWLEIEDLHDAILTGAPPRITPADTRGHVETLTALLASAQTDERRPPAFAGGRPTKDE